MNRVERDFRRSLTRRVREVVHASPEMRTEWQRRRWHWPWWRIALAIPVWIVFALYAITALPSIISFLVLHPHVMRLYGSAQPILIPTPDYAFVPMTLAISAVVCFATGFGSNTIGPGRELGRLAYFPILDREYLNRSLRGMAFLGLLAAGCLVPAFVGIAAFDHFSAWQITGLVVGVLLQVVHCLALIVAIAPRVRENTWQQGALMLTAIGLAIAALCANGFSEHIWRHWHTIAAVVLATPIGWPNAAFAHGVIGGHWWGWLFLLPLPLAVAAALMWLRRGYAIREVVISPTGDVMPTYEFGLTNADPEAPSAPPVLTRRESANATEASLAEKAAAARKRILSGEPFAPVDWSTLGLIERFAARFLSHQQRTLLEHVYGGRIRWTRAWLLSATAGLVPLGLMFALRCAPTKPGELKGEDFTILSWLIFLPIFEVAACLRRSDFELTPQSRRKPKALCHLLFPVDDQALAGAMRRMCWLRLPFWLPLFAEAAAVLAIGRPDWPVFLAVNMVLGVVLAHVAVSTLARLPRGRAKSSPNISWKRIAIMVPLVCLAFALPFGLFLYLHWLLTLCFLAVLLALAWIANRHSDRHYLHADFDLPPAPAA